MPRQLGGRRQLEQIVFQPAYIMIRVREVERNEGSPTCEIGMLFLSSLLAACAMTASGSSAELSTASGLFRDGVHY